MKEVWEMWIPKNKLVEKYYVDSLKNDVEGLTIVLTNDINEKKLILRWEGVVESYTCSEESSRNELYANDSLTKWTFFNIKNSKYIEWINRQSSGICSLKELQHFCIVAIDSIVDIIAEYEPEIEEL
jgi:hypothetical protein